MTRLRRHPAHLRHERVQPGPVRRSDRHRVASGVPKVSKRTGTTVAGRPNAPSSRVAGTVTLADLILPPPAWHDHVLEVCHRHSHTRPPTIRHARNPEFLLGLILAGRGIAFEPRAHGPPRAAGGVPPVGRRLR